MEPSQEPISVRINRINAYILGKLDATKNFTHAFTKESLLDALQLLYDECNTDHLKNSDRNIKQFIEKNRKSISTLKQLRVNLSDFDIKNVIGRGHFGEVHLVKEIQTGDIYAMKTIKKYKSLEQKYTSFEEERNIMAFSLSPWITKLQYAFHDSANLYFIMEYHPGGDLLGLLNRQGGTLPETAASFYIAEIVLGLNDLHNMGYVHRDIKPDNILLDRCGHIKLVDFGSASTLGSKGEASNIIPIGTPDYIAPEVLQSLDNRNQKAQYGVVCDYWSLGILAYELTIGTTPFLGQNTTGTYSKILNHKNTLKFPPDVVLSQAYVSLIKGLLTNQESRLSYKEIITHPLYSNTDFTTLRDQVPPFVPKITSVDDTSNFTDILDRKKEPHIDDFKTKTQFSGKNLPFVGFTYTFKTGNEYKDNSYSSNSSLMKDETLASMKKEIERLQKAIRKNEDSFQEMENIGKNMRKNAGNWKMRKVKDRKDLERKALDLIKSAKVKWEAAEKIKIDSLSEDMNKQQDKITRLEQENRALHDQIREISKLENMHKASLERVENLSRRSVVNLESRLQKVTVQSQNDITDIQTKLSVETNKNFDLENKVMNYEKLNSYLKSEVETLRHKILVLQKSIDQSTVTIKEQEDVIETLKHAKEKGFKFKEKIKDIQEENASLKMKVNNWESVENILKQEKSNCTLLTKELEALRADLEFEKLSHQTILEEIAEKRKHEVQKLNEELKEALNKNSENERKLKEADLNEENYRFKIKALEDLLTELQSGVSKLENSSEKQGVLQQQIERLEQQLVEVHESFAVEKQEFIQFKSKHWRLEKQFENATLDKKIVERDLKEIKEENIKLTNEINTLNTTLGETKKMHQKALLELNNLNENLSSEIMKLTDIVNNLEEKLQFEKEKSDDEKTIVQQLNKESAEKDKEYQALQREYDALVFEKNNYQKQLEHFEASNSKLINQFERIMKEKADLFNEIENYKKEQHNNQVNRNTLRETCVVLEDQLVEYEQLYKESEDKRNVLATEIDKLKADLAAEINNIMEARKLTNEEKSFKLLAETKCRKLAEDIEHLQEENSSYKDQCKEFKSYSSTLSEELNVAEQRITDLKIEIKNLTRQIENCLSENQMLKEENSNQLTHLNSVKESNYKLGQDLNEFRNLNKALFEQSEQLNNLLIEKDIFLKERELKTESTIHQQTKLIDFLQSKLQMEENKKKKTLSDKLFGPSKKENQPPLSLVLNYRDLEHQLTKERDVTKNLRQEIIELKSKLYPDSSEKVNTVLDIKDHRKVLAQIVQSPQKNELYRQNSVQRMHHNIPHRFDTKICAKPITCNQCRNQIALGRTSRVCSECLITVHPQCISNLPSTCGLPHAFAKHYSDSLSRLHDSKAESANEISNETANIDIESWVKIPVKSSWEKYYACLTANTITIYEEPPNNETVKVVKSLDLKPPDSYGKVTMEPVVSEIGIPVANSDLPFVLKVEVSPNTTCWPPKYLIFMTLSIENRDKWCKALERIFNKTGEKYMGEDIYELTKEIDVNCIIEVDKDIKLFGADKGLFSYNNSTLNHISGPLHIHQIATLPKLNLVLMIVDENRVLISCDLRHLQSLCECAPCSKPSLQFQTINIKNMNGFHLFRTSCDKTNMLCIANARQLTIMKYDFKCKTFIPERILDTAEPTSCILFTEHSLIIGADKFFEIDLATYHADEFLDVSDRKLSSAITCYKLKSFPLSILRISKNPVEYLLCFHEFATFVDEYGRSTRGSDIKWTHLPHAFFYNSGYLYVVQFYAIEIIKITLDTMNDSTSSTDFESYKMEFPNVKYLGHGDNGIYIKTGNYIKYINASNLNPDTSLPLTVDTEQIDCDSDRFSFTSSIVQSLDGHLSDTESVPTSDRNSEVHKKVKFSTDL
ncbi:myotonic dystrophy s/t kinase-related [Holotrichia oblita]|uniref:Myotonic dystrophy s/t kinase-related n=1 Tax=Holotrichia oblita TaxID=644536 RepID=A0ACB9TA55_HOLOL|nr:myotonic dystrophy s/t kinase-related [Holotrichia oblita]